MQPNLAMYLRHRVMKLLAFSGYNASIEVLLQDFVTMIRNSAGGPSSWDATVIAQDHQDLLSKN